MRLRDALRWLTYPTLLAGALWLLGTLLAHGASLAWAPYVSAALVGGLIVAIERAIPYRPEWQPKAADLVDDSLFLVMVQIALPPALAWLTIWITQGLVADRSFALALWPNHWPILGQLAAKIVLGDFLRYWLHRAAHTWTPLWRLHAVHHQPEKLYTTNVFRFHPVEKALQFVCDTLPFILMGIGPDVLGYYFVFYAVSGLFQHSNCDIRLGWLNYVVSGPEVHRWHHSRRTPESNHNYAHSFVVWDLLFGTYFRPRNLSVDNLGLIARGYPRRFLGLLVAPFSSRALRENDGTA
jgi:sterol desaturase/sphingolipid hydroxylase (fatty acid hydroxylase superfamily)